LAAIVWPGQARAANGCVGQKDNTHCTATTLCCSGICCQPRIACCAGKCCANADEECKNGKCKRKPSPS
jgi:hypothetical protein